MQGVVRRAALLRYDGIKALADTLGRPASTLIALAPANDPFAITPARREGAQWFARIWRRFGLGSGVHARRIHYQLVSQERPVKLPNGVPYENTLEAWQALIRTSNDARFLDLVPAEDFIDRRNNEPLIYLSDEGDEDASLDTIFDDPRVEIAAAQMPLLPHLHLTRPTIPQPYHIELWCEKTTINDVLEPLASQYGCNVVTGSGELSQTACVNVVERAEASQRPVRILYISDFDPAGLSMPVAVARKIEHRLYLKNLIGLDMQVRPIALTLDQCQQFRLPRTPIKATERRAAAFERRNGAGATELDALEAIRPGELRKIVEREILRYFDADLDDAVTETAAETDRSIAKITRDVHAEHGAKIETLRSQFDEIAKDHARKIAEWRKAAKPVWRAIDKDLRAQAPDPDEIAWPEPMDGDEDDDPLFDSLRGYVEQIDRYKAQQGKPITRRGANHVVPDADEDGGAR